MRAIMFVVNILFVSVIIWLVIILALHLRAPVESVTNNFAVTLWLSTFIVATTMVRSLTLEKLQEKIHARRPGPVREHIDLSAGQSWRLDEKSNELLLRSGIDPTDYTTKR